MTWILLAVAIVIEVAATSALKLAGQGRPLAIAGVVAGYTVSFALVAWVVQRLEVGIVYAIWSGVGTALVALVGVALYGEAVTALKLAGLALIVLGVVTLNLAGAH
jgi:small multidrug resistance pump